MKNLSSNCLNKDYLECFLILIDHLCLSFSHFIFLTLISLETIISKPDNNLFEIEFTEGIYITELIIFESEGS